MALYLTLAGGFGALMRFIVDGLVRTFLGRSFPWGMLFINISGSIVLGFITGLALQSHIATDLKLIIGTGFCGGYTTFSTESFETVRLLEERRYKAAALNSMGTLSLALLGAAIGLILAYQY